MGQNKGSGAAGCDALGGAAAVVGSEGVLAVPAGWLANFLISYAALRRSWPEDKAAVSQ